MIMAYVFYTCGIHNIEEATIKEILGKHKEASLEEIAVRLAMSSDQELCKFFDRPDYIQQVFLPSVFLNRMMGQKYMDGVIALSPETVPGGMSVLAQVCALIGHRATRYENLVSAFAYGYIDILRVAGATDEEIKQITLRDRLLRGGTMADEKTATGLIRVNKPVQNERGYLVREYVDVDNPNVMRALTDYTFTHEYGDGKHSCTLVFASYDNENRLVEAKTFSNDIFGSSDFLSKNLKNRGYKTELEKDQRTGLNVVTIKSDDETELVKESPADYFGCPII